MNDIFPSIATATINDVAPGSIIQLSRFGGILALVTDQEIKGSRSLVILNKPASHGTSVIFAEGWRNDETALIYKSDVRFEINMGAEGIDPTGRKWQETPGVLSLAGDDTFILAAPQDSFHGQHKLVNIQTGAVALEPTSRQLWSFASWRLFLRDPHSNCDHLLLKFPFATSSA